MNRPFARRLYLLPCLALGVFAAMFLSAGEYFQDFSGSVAGDTVFTDGASLQSSHLGTAALVVDSVNPELRLTANGVGSCGSAFLLPDLDAGRRILAFSARWNAVISGNFPQGADGVSFNFGPIGALDLVASQYKQERGFGAGLSVSVQTFNLGDPGYVLRIDGKIVPEGFVSKQPEHWGVLDDTRHFFETDWNIVDGLTLRVDGVTIFDRVRTAGFVPRVGDRFAWAARTGLQTEGILLDNLVVTTGGNLTPVATTAPHYGGGPLATLAMAFDGDTATQWDVGVGVLINVFVGATQTEGPDTVFVYALTSAGDLPDADPSAWTLDSGDDGVNWTTRDSRSGQRWVNRHETRAWPVSAPARGGKFRIRMTANNGRTTAPRLQLAEVRAWSKAEFPSSGSYAVTGYASGVGSDTAVFDGVVVPLLDEVTDWWFEWGVTAAYGNRTETNSLPAGTSDARVNARLGGLSYGETYHMRLMIRDSAGTHAGRDVSFRSPVAIEPTTGLPKTYRGSVAWGDYDNDGRLDLLVTGDTVFNGFVPVTFLGRNRGDGTFESVGLPGVAQVSDSMTAWADYDGDGWLDFIVAGRSSDGRVTQLWRNGGDGTFSRVPLPGVPGVAFGGVAWGDFDNDGRPDFLLTGADADAPSQGTAYSQLWRNVGNGSFSQILLPAVMGAEASAVAWGDFDGDAWPDFAILGRLSRLHQCLWRNMGDGTFSVSAPLPGLINDFGGYSSIAWGDCDEDGRLDLLMMFKTSRTADRAGHVRLWNNLGGGAWREIPAGANSGMLHGHYGTVGWADYDQDGRLDFMASTVNSPLRSLMRNIGGGTFTNAPLDGLTRAPTYASAWADLDRDGDLDFVESGLVGYGSTEVRLQAWRNPMNISNAPPAAPVGLGITITNSGRINFHWTTPADDHTPSASLTYNLRVGTTPGGGEIVRPPAGPDGTLRVAAMGTLQTGTNAILVRELAPGGYYWAVQAVDGGYAGGPFAEGRFVVGAPVAQDDQVVRAPGRSIKMSASSLLTNDFANTAPVLVSVQNSGASGATVTLLPAGWVVYEPAPDAGDEPDTFTYTATDGTYMFTGTVTVVTRETQDPTRNIIATVLTGEPGLEVMQITAAGVPGRDYRLQYADLLVSPMTWTDLDSAVPATAAGRITFTDPVPASPRFYRVIESPRR